MEEDLASQGLALVTYLDQLDKPHPYTWDWYYQPGMGWLWTKANTFPFVYRAPAGDQAGGGSISASWRFSQAPPSTTTHPKPGSLRPHRINKRIRADYQKFFPFGVAP